MPARISMADYAVLCATAMLSVITGLYYAFKERRHQGSVLRYHLGARKLKALPVALSLLVTFESSIFFLGYPAEVYVYGCIFWLSNVGMFIGYSNMFWTSVPLVYPLRITSIYEYLEMRYGAAEVRRFASLTSCLSMVLYSGIVLFGAGTALESVTDIPAWTFVIGMCFVAVLYTALGGLKAVVATDVIQGVIMLSAIFAVIIKGTLDVGGVSNVIALNKPSGRTRLVDFDPNPMVRHTFWSLVVGNSINSMYISFKQPSVQRLNSTSSQAEARKVVLISLPMFFILQLIVNYEGLVAFAYFADKGCDPLASGDITNPNQIVSYTVLDMFQRYNGLPGLFLGALCSASLSTISSLLSSISAVVSEDIFRDCMKDVTDVQLTRISKVIVVVTGAVCSAIAIIIGQIEGPLSQISVTIIGSVDAPLTALFLMSAYIGFITRKGALTGALFGLAFGGWLSAGFNFSPGRKVTPWLPLGPTDQCQGLNTTGNVTSSNGSSNSTNVFNELVSPRIIGKYSTAPMFPAMFSTSVPDTVEPAITGLDNLYSISYAYFPAMIIIVTITVGIIASKLTQSKTQETPSDRLVLSIRKQFLCCFRNNDKTEEPMELSKLNT